MVGLSNGLQDVTGFNFDGWISFGEAMRYGIPKYLPGRLQTEEATKALFLLL